MINFPHRLFALMLCLCMLFSAAFSLAEESAAVPSGEGTEAMDGESAWSLRFGRDAVVETDKDGNPVSVNGYPARTVRAGFNNLGQSLSFQMTADFMDYPFWQPATRYDGNLAVMSLMMAGSACRSVGFRDVPAEDFDPSLILEHFLTDAGFSDIRKDDYSKVPTMFTVSTAMGTRKMTHDGQEPFTLIAIGVCGDNYENEWESNMTAGTGEIHEGFQSAAQLVIDRLAGYIATRGIQGRVKVWISGFSRAAAVSNLVAGALVDTGFLPKEDVFAYTFATPAAIKNPPREGYENIFNIIDPADFVPQVMPAEWGYGRYGTDRFLSVPEFSSYLGFLDTAMRTDASRQNYSVEYNYSPALTLRIRLLISLLMDLIENEEKYTACFQPAMVGLLRNGTVDSTVSILRDLMRNIELLNREDEARLDHVIDYFLQVFSGIATRSGYADANRNTGSMFMRFMVEHTMNSYFSTIDSIRNGDFDSCDSCCYVMVRGPVSLTLRDESAGVEVLTVRSDGSVSVSEDFGQSEWLSKMFYTERVRQTTVLCVPMDSDFRVSWTAEKDGTLECIQAMSFLRAGSRYPGASSGKVRIRAGETGTAFRNRGRESIALEGYTEQSFDALTLAEFLGIASLGFNWRLALTVLFALLALLICLFLCLIAAFRPARRKRYSFLTWAVLCLLGIAAFESETAYWFLADEDWIRLAWKCAAALCFVLLFFLLRRKNGSLLRTFFPSVLLALAADAVMSLHFAAGAALLLLARVLLSCQFLRRAPMRRRKWILWAALSLPSVVMIILFYAPWNETMGWFVAAYMPVLLLMAFSIGNQSLQIRVSAVLLLISDLLLGLYTTLLNDPMLHVTCTVLFYTALLILTLELSPSPAQPAGIQAENDPGSRPQAERP